MNQKNKTNGNTTTFATEKTADRRWVLVDADGQVLGRLASRIALVLRGKHKITFTPYLDTGDFVIVINAKKIKVTGNKATQKLYSYYSGYPGGLKQWTFEDVMQRHPDRIIQHAVKRMLPVGPLGRKMLTKLKIYPGAEHPHESQQPTKKDLN